LPEIYSDCTVPPIGHDDSGFLLLLMALAQIQEHLWRQWLPPLAFPPHAPWAFPYVLLPVLGRQTMMFEMNLKKGKNKGKQIFFHF